MPSTLNYSALKHTKFNAYSLPNSQLMSGDGSNGLKVWSYVVQKITSTGWKNTCYVTITKSTIQHKYFVGYKFRGFVKILILWKINFTDCKQA